MSVTFEDYFKIHRDYIFSLVGGNIQMFEDIISKVESVFKKTYPVVLTDNETVEVNFYIDFSKKELEFLFDCDSYQFKNLNRYLSNGWESLKIRKEVSDQNWGFVLGLEFTFRGKLHEGVFDLWKNKLH